MNNTKPIPRSKPGYHHSYAQRTTALALIPLFGWFLFAAYNLSHNHSILALREFFLNPINAISAVLFVSISLYHGCIGIGVILEDYVQDKLVRKSIYNLVAFISIITVLAFMLPLIVLHVS